MQDVERVARALCEASGKNPDKMTPAPRGVLGMVPLWALWEKQATAAISAMPNNLKHTTLAIAMHCGEDVGFDRGWNAAIEAAADKAIKGRNFWRDKCEATKNRRESRDYETMAITCGHIEHAISQLKKDTGDLAQAEAPTEPHLEFRPDENGDFDEIVARFSDGSVHVETMSDKRCYVVFRWSDGRYCQWHISSGKALKYSHEQGKDTGNPSPKPPIL
jgi:hypothetical protein